MHGAFVTVVNVLAALSSLAIYLSPAQTLYRVYTERKTGDVSILPLVSMMASCCVWAMYGFLASNVFPLFATMAFGFVLSIVYIVVYCRFTAQRKRAFQILGAVVLFVVLVASYVALGVTGATGQTTHEVATVMGYVGSVVSFLLYASPFEKIAQVLRSKSAASIPIYLSVTGAVGNLLWTLSGILTFDLFVLLPNAICSVPPLIQCALYFAFRPAHQTAVVDLCSVPSPVVKPPTPLRTSDTGATQYEELASPVHADTRINIA